MWSYLAQSLLWSGFGLAAGAVLGELGYDIGKLVRHSGRHHGDDHT